MTTKTFVLGKREREIIYYALSRALQMPFMINGEIRKPNEKEFKEIDDLRDLFYEGDAMPTY